MRLFFLPAVFSLYIMQLWVLTPRLVLHLAERGTSAAWIGLFSAMPYVSILLTTPFLPRLHTRLSLKTLLLLCMAAESLLMLGYLLQGSLLVWMLIAWLGGLSGALVWSLSETLIAAQAPAQAAGRYMGLYQTLMGLGMAAGPLVAAHGPQQLPHVVLLTAACTALLTVLLWRFYTWPPMSLAPHTRETQAAAPRSPHPWLWLLLPAALAGGTFEGGLDHLSIVFALPHYSAQTALYVPSVIALGSLLAQYPMGHWADRRGLHTVLRVMLWALILNSVLFAALYAQWPWTVWLWAPVWGACGGCLYTLSMASISKSKDAQSLVSGVGLLVMAYASGKIVGPVLGGLAYDAAASAGLGLVMATLAALALGMWTVAQRKPL